MDAGHARGQGTVGRPADLAVIGTGYVGLVTAACLARLGHTVAGLDIDARRVDALRRAEVPFHEPGLPELVAEGVASGRLRFTTEPGEALAKAQALLVAVGTPSRADGAADLSHLEAAVDTVARHAPNDALLVVRSTVPPGTGDALSRRLQEAGRGDLVALSMPEFLAEGTAVKDFLQPERVVFGGPPDATARLAAFFDGLPATAPRLHVGRRTAELAKYAANTFLAARISLVNEMANLCDALGADVVDLARIVGTDRRIGPHFLRPGLGYGGSCFPKDLKALQALAGSHGVAVPVVAAVQETNEAQWRLVLERVRRKLGSLRGKTIAVWGIAFKPGTDDTREAPGLRLMAALVAAGATVRAHDPKGRLPATLKGAQQVAEPLEAARGAHLLVQATEWPEYREVDPARLAAVLAPPRHVIDARNTLALDRLAAAGLSVEAIGLPAKPGTVTALARRPAE